MKNGQEISEVSDTKYDLKDVEGVLIKHLKGYENKHKDEARIIAPKFIKRMHLLNEGVTWDKSSFEIPDDMNQWSEEAEAMKLFDGEETSKELEKLGSPVIKEIRKEFGKDWYIPAPGEIHEVFDDFEKIGKLLDMVSGSDKLGPGNLGNEFWTSARSSKYGAFRTTWTGVQRSGFTQNDGVKTLAMKKLTK